ncbi:MAG: CvpA family protein [Oscillospiraceae bacterium]
MNYIVYDLVILAILILFALWGMHRGLILTLCSLVALLVAFVGAILVSNFWSPSVAGWLQPLLQPTTTSAVESALPEGVTDAELPLDELIILLDEADLPFGLDEFVSDLREEGVPVLSAGSLVESVSVSLAAKLANAIAYIGLFLLSFVLILILWRLLARALNLVARLPGLHMLNKVGGLAVGVLQGAILLFICAWLVRWLWSDLIPPDAVEQSKLLHFFMTVNPLEYFTSR